MGFALLGARGTCSVVVVVILMQERLPALNIKTRWLEFIEPESRKARRHALSIVDAWAAHGVYEARTRLTAEDAESAE
jgi:hypothetical protein